MPTVYRIMFEHDYQYLEPVDGKAFLRERHGDGIWNFDGTPKGNRWKPMEFYSREPKLKKPDIWKIAGEVAFEPEAAKIVQTFLDQSCETFLLPFEGRNLTVINVTYVLNCLDKKKSVYDPELPHMIDEYVFHEDRIDYSLFKIPETCQGEILTVEGLAGPEDEFKPVVEKHKLKGLWFQELYSWEGEEKS